MNKTQLQKQLKQETKYSRWYLNIIENANNQNRFKLSKLNEDYQYYENHHILPESLFEEFVDLKLHPWNGVLLTAREHFICHSLIQKHYQKIEYTHGDIKMSKAINWMNKLGKYNSKGYANHKLNLSHSEETKDKMSLAQKGIPKPHISEYLTGKPRKQSTKTKISKTMQGNSFTDEHKINIGKSRRGIVFTDEHKINIGKSGIGRKVTKETRDKISKSSKGIKKPQKIITCPHCGKSGGHTVMPRWHFDKCKSL